MSPNRTVGALQRLDRACAERLAGLADIKFMLLYYSNYRNLLQVNIHHLLLHTMLRECTPQGNGF